MHCSVTSCNGEVPKRVPVVSSLPPTSERMNDDDLKEVTHPAGFERSETGVHTASSEVFSERARKAFFDDEMVVHFPKCRVDIIYGEHTLRPIVDGVSELQELRKRADEAGVKGRPMRIFIFPKANHFVSLSFVFSRL